MVTIEMTVVVSEMTYMIIIMYKTACGMDSVRGVHHLRVLWD